MVGAESFSVVSDSSNGSIPVVRDGATDGIHAVYQHDPGRILTVLWLPPTLAPVFRIEIRKDAKIPRLKVYTSVPLANGERLKRPATSTWQSHLRTSRWP